MSTHMTLGLIAVGSILLLAVYIWFREHRGWPRVILIPVITSVMFGLVGLLVPTEERQAFAEGFDAADAVYQSQLDEAVASYSDGLGALIASDDYSPRARARAIVSLRNDLRDPLVALPRLLSDEIDSLEALLTTTGRSDDGSILETLEVMQIQWPDKSALIREETGSLIESFGFPPSLKENPGVD